MKTSKEEMLKVIYEKIADKTLSFGCRVKMDFINSGSKWTIDIVYWDTGETLCTNTGKYNNETWYNEPDRIIGHPVMIGDVLDWMQSEGIPAIDYERDMSSGKEFIGLYLNWRLLRESIDDQSDETIKFVYDLILGVE